MPAAPAKTGKPCRCRWHRDRAAACRRSVPGRRADAPTRLRAARRAATRSAHSPRPRPGCAAAPAVRLRPTCRQAVRPWPRAQRGHRRASRACDAPSCSTSLAAPTRSGMPCRRRHGRRTARCLTSPQAPGWPASADPGAERTVHAHRPDPSGPSQGCHAAAGSHRARHRAARERPVRTRRPASAPAARRAADAVRPGPAATSAIAHAPGVSTTSGPAPTGSSRAGASSPWPLRAASVAACAGASPGTAGSRHSACQMPGLPRAAARRPRR